MTKTNQTNNYALLLDSGNTRLKIAVLDIDNQIILNNIFAIEHKDINAQNIKEFLLFFDGILSNNPATTSPSKHKIPNEHTDHKGLIDFIKIIGVNVAGAAKQEHINNILYDLTNIKPNWISVTQAQAGVFNHYENINKLGVDRWLGMVGLSKIAQQNSQVCILASFGTATTIDTLVAHDLLEQNCYNSQFTQSRWLKFLSMPNKQLENIDWHFIGGTILPGPSLMALSLETNTANLPNAVGETQDFPLETFQAISSGISGAQTGAVIRQWQAALDTFNTPPKLYISGGGANLIKHELNLAIKKAQDLNNIKPCAPIELNTPVTHGLATYID